MIALQPSLWLLLPRERCGLACVDTGMRIAAFILSSLIAPAVVSQALAQAPAPEQLQSPTAFEKTADLAQRSRAIFTEIGKLLTHPRCMNCHPAGDQPLQTAEHKPHWPPVPPDGCAACHTEANVTLHAAVAYQSIPGHPRWQLAPHSMAWQGKSLGEICEAQGQGPQRRSRPGAPAGAHGQG